MARADRKTRREERRRRRQMRVEGRKQLMAIAAEVYEEGDDSVELIEKITERLESDFAEDRPFLAFLLELLETFGPLLIKLLMGFA